MLAVIGAPSRYVQGRNATDQLGAEMKAMGLNGKVFVIASKTARKHLDSAWSDTFSQAGIKFQVFNFGGECSGAEIDAAKAAAKKAGAEIIVGAGGGKVLDTARAVASELELPIVNCPTVASSDAPCSALSVVYTEDGQFDHYKFYKRNPDLVLVDTSVVAKAPARLLVAGMGDALATWFEAKTVIAARKKNQLGGATTLSGEALAKLCYETLLNDGVAALQSVRAHAVTPALERLIEANTYLSGLGFESGGLAIAHSVHNGLTTAAETHSYYHGEKVAFGLIVQLVAEGAATEVIEQVLDFSSSVGLPITLKELNIGKLSDATLKKIAKRATAPGETAHNEPFEVTAELIADAIRGADALGQHWKRLGENGSSSRSSDVPQLLANRS